MRNFWALAIGYSSEGAFRCIASYIVCPRLPSLGWDKKVARDLLSFSKKLLGSSFLNFIFLRADVFVLAKLFSPAVIGVYIIAVSLVQTPTSFLINIFNRILLTTYARLQDDNARTNRIYLKLASLIFFVGLTVVSFSLVFGRSALTMVYGKRYGVASGPLTAAAGVAVVMLLNNAITNIFYARGVPELHRRCQMIMATSILVSIYPLIRCFGITGGQLACLASAIAGFSLQIFYLNRVTGLDVRANPPFSAFAFLLPATVSYKRE
jgi:O-antigen/teichoic acid export membrane protein